VGWGNKNRLAGGRDGKGSESRSADVKVEMGLVQKIGWKGRWIWTFIGIHTWF
jgi:hypothetical protein